MIIIIYSFLICRILFAGESLTKANNTPWNPVPACFSEKSFTIGHDVPRSQINESCQWKVQDIFKTKEEWKNELEKLSLELANLPKECSEEICGSSEFFLRCYKEYYKVKEEVLKVFSYSKLNYYVEKTDEANTDYKEGSSLLKRFRGKYSSCFRSKINLVGREMIYGFMSDPPYGAQLILYKSDIDEILQKQDNSNDSECQNIQAPTVGKPNIDNRPEEDKVKELWDTTIGKEIIEDSKTGQPMTVEEFYNRHVKDSDREVRKKAFEVYYLAMEKYSEDFVLRFNKFLKDSTPKTKNSYGQAITKSLNDMQIPVNIYNNLIDVVNKNLPKTLYEYVRIMKNILGIKNFAFYDLYVPLINTKHPSIKYPDAIKLIKKSLEPLGTDYANILLFASNPDNGWVDIYPNSEKERRFYTYYVYGVHPFILLNFNNSYSSMLETAHELGHSIHSFYTGQTEPIAYFDIPQFVTEIASVTNEMFVHDYNLTNNDLTNDEKIFALAKFLEKSFSELIRDTMIAEFEKLIHEKFEAAIMLDPKAAIILDSKVLGAEYIKILQKYYGTDFKAVKLNQTPQSLFLGETDWIFWYKEEFAKKFHVFNYATSMAIAIKIVKSLKEGTITKNDYLTFLSLGSSLTPRDLLLKLKIDITKPDYISDAMDYLANKLKEFEQLSKGIPK